MRAAGAPVALDGVPEGGDLGAAVRRAPYGLEDLRGAVRDERAHPGVGVQDTGRVARPPHGLEPGAFGDRDGLVVACQRHVEDLAQHRGLGAEGGGHRGTGDAGRCRHVGQRCGGVPARREQVGGGGEYGLPGAPGAVLPRG